MCACAMKGRQERTTRTIEPVGKSWPTDVRKHNSPAWMEALGRANAHIVSKALGGSPLYVFITTNPPGATSRLTV